MKFTKHISGLLLFTGILFSLNAQGITGPIVNKETVFDEQNGMAAVEAEFFMKQSKTDQRQWFRTSKNENSEFWQDSDGSHCMGAGNNAYIELLPDSRATHDDKLIPGKNFSNEPGVAGVLHYLVNIKNPGRYYVWVRAFSTGSEDNGIHVGIDGQWPESGQRMQWCDGKNTWQWESKQRTDENHCGVPHQIFLDILVPGIHELQFSMREDGFEFDRFLLTKDVNYIPEGIGPGSLLYSGKLPESYPLVTVNPENGKKQPSLSGELKKWHTIALAFEGPKTAEDDEYNPFMNYRFNVVFTHSETGQTMTVPGYFAADGNAAETSSNSGSIWKVHFAPDKTGEWTYKVDFRKGNWVAVSESAKPGSSAAYMDEYSGSFKVEESDKSGKDLRSKGRLQYDGTRYLKFAETNEVFLKVGPDAPENFLSYADFDGTFANDGHKDNLVKTWEPHLLDWKQGDPMWKDGKGKAIIGAVNYLSDKGLNSISFLTMNIGGDDQNVFPYIDYDTYNRFDCSKLDQWEILFSHAQKLGMFLHFKIMESENQGLLDNGAIGANTKLLYRELIARFGHHLAMNWNIGEELGEWENNHQTPPLNTTQRQAAAQYFYENDPYHHHVVIHNGVNFDDILGPDSKYTGVSLQVFKVNLNPVHPNVKEWLQKSKEAGKQWAVALDEPGDAKHGLITDSEDPKHDSARINGLWGAFMAGAWGTEWYFGYDHPHSDLTCQDFRSRDLFWNQCIYLLDFFKGNAININETENYDQLVQVGDYCLAIPGEEYIVFLRNGSGTINLENQTGEFMVKWFDPRNGGKLQTGKETKIKAGKLQKIEGAPSEPNKDWVVLIKKGN